MQLGQPSKVLSLGETEVPEEIFMEMLSDMKAKYTEKTFHVLKNNSNTFTDEVASLVLGQGIPAEYAQLPREFFTT